MKAFSDRDIQKALCSYPLTEDAADGAVRFSEDFTQKMDTLLRKRRFRDRMALTARVGLVTAVLALAIPAIAWLTGYTESGDDPQGLTPGAGGAALAETPPAEHPYVIDNENYRIAANETAQPSNESAPWPAEAIAEDVLDQDYSVVDISHYMDYQTWEEAAAVAPFTLLVPTVIPNAPSLSSVRADWFESSDEKFMVSAFYGLDTTPGNIVTAQNISQFSKYIYFSQQIIEEDDQLSHADAAERQEPGDDTIRKPVMIGEAEGWLYSFTGGEYWTLNWTVGHIAYSLHNPTMSEEELIAIAASLVPADTYSAQKDTTFISTWSVPQDRDTSEMVVMMDGELLLSLTIDTRVGEYSIAITGHPDAAIDVYFDGKLHSYSRLKRSEGSEIYTGGEPNTGDGTEHSEDTE